MPSLARSPIVIDAGTAIGALLPTLAPFDTLELFIAWRQASIAILAPPLWLAECTSVIRRYIHSGLLTTAEGATALDDLAVLEVTIVPDTFARCRTAYDWAARLGQVRACDGFYLALAQESAALFHTGDRRLANAAHLLGIEWVFWVGDA